MSATVQIALGITAGSALAYLHLRTLRPSVDWLAQGRAAPAIGLQLARFALLAVGLLSMTAIGPAALAASAAALVIGRAVVLRWMKDRLT